MVSKTDIESFERLCKCGVSYIHKWKDKTHYKLRNSEIKPLYTQDEEDYASAGYVRPVIFLPHKTIAAFYQSKVFVQSAQSISKRSEMESWVLSNIRNTDNRTLAEKLVSACESAEKRGSNVLSFLLSILQDPELVRRESEDHLNASREGIGFINHLNTSGGGIGRFYLVRHLNSDKILPLANELKEDVYPAAHALVFSNTDISKMSRGLERGKSKIIGRDTSIENINLKKFSYLQFLENLRIVFVPDEIDDSVFSPEARANRQGPGAKNISKFIRQNNYDASFYH